jgi:hypothetical protein
MALSHRHAIGSRKFAGFPRFAFSGNQGKSSQIRLDQGYRSVLIQSHPALPKCPVFALSPSTSSPVERTFNALKFRPYA